jgi:predicted nuclease with TOPRIM domain
MNSTTSTAAVETSSAAQPSEKAKRQSKAIGDATPDPITDLERRNSLIDERLQKLSDEQRELQAKRRTNVTQIASMKEKRLNDFMRSTELASHSPEVWKAAQAEIQAALAKVASAALNMKRG